MKFSNDRERKRFFARKRSGRPDIYYALLGNRIVVEFGYDPARVKAIKAAGGRYIPDEKRWSIPRERLKELEESGAFQKESSIIAMPGVLDETAPQPATGSIRINPFSASEEEIAAIRPDVVVRGKGKRPLLRVAPRLGMNGQKIVEKVPGAHFVRKDNAYWVPSSELVALVKSFRDAGVSFAVESSVAEKLKSTADERNDLVQGRRQGTAEAFERTGLYPYITVGDPNVPSFQLCGFSGEQLQRLMTLAKGRKIRSERPGVFSREQLLSLFAGARTLDYPLWFTQEVHEWLDRERQQIADRLGTAGPVVDDTDLELVEPGTYWGISEGFAALFLESATHDRLSDEVRQVLAEFTVPDASGREIFRFPFTKVAAVFDAVSKAIPHALQSASFCTILEHAQEHERLWIRTRTFGLMRDVPPLEVAGLSEAEAARLFPHQRVAVKWLLETPCALLGDDMGLGKTLSVLSYFASLRNSESVDLLLVIAPTSLTRNWSAEAKQWFPRFNVCVISGDKAEKTWMLRLLASETLTPDIVIVNYEAGRLEYVKEGLESLVGRERCLLCLDESQRVKNHASKTYESLLRVADKAKRRVLLSGTPTQRDITDIWAQYRLLDGGGRFGKSFYRWLESIAELGNKFSEFAVKSFRPAAVDEAMARAQEILLRRRKEAVLDLPEKTFSTRYVALTGDQLSRYDEVREELFLRMRTLSGKQFTREITNVLEQYLRAVQIASNPRLLDPLWKGDPAKFLELDEIVREVVDENGGKLVIWTNYLANVNELTTRYAKYGAAPFSGEVSADERHATVKAFQTESAPRILVAVPAAGGVGITLTAAQTAVYIDRTWNAEHWLQSIDRIHRIGQAGTVSIIVLSSCKLDELIGGNLRKKERSQSALLGDTVTGASARTDEEDYPSVEELLEAVSA